MSNYFAHSSAIIDEGCQVGEGSHIWHFTHLMNGSIIGRNCSLGQNIFIAAGVVLGNNVKVQNNVSVYEGVICEDDVFLGPSVVFTNILFPRSTVDRRGQYQKTQIRKGATIGANATILCGIEIGKYAFIGAGAVVTKSVSSYALVTGNPAMQTGWVSEMGEKLHFGKEDKATCSLSGDVYLLANNSVSKISVNS